MRGGWAAWGVQTNLDGCYSMRFFHSFMGGGLYLFMGSQRRTHDTAQLMHKNDPIARPQRFHYWPRCDPFHCYYTSPVPYRRYLYLSSCPTERDPFILHYWGPVIWSSVSQSRVSKALFEIDNSYPFWRKGSESSLVHKRRVTLTLIASIAFAVSHYTP